MLDQILLQLDREGIKEREDGEIEGRWGEAVIILNISIKGEQLFEGGDVIEGRLIFEEIRHSRKTLHELSNIFVVHAWHVARI